VFENLSDDDARALEAGDPFDVQAKIFCQGAAWLTVVGVGGVNTSIALHHQPLFYYDNGKPYDGISTEQVILFVGGASCLGFGIPVSIVGGYKQPKYKKLIKGISVGGESSYQGRGIKVVFHI